MSVQEESSAMFAGHTAEEFPFDGQVIEIPSTMSVNDAFRLLSSNNILSVPVFDEEKQKYLGFFDVSDALSIIFNVDLVLSALPDGVLNQEVALGVASGSTFNETILVSSLFDDLTDSREAPERTPWIPVTNSTPMEEVLYLLGTSTRRVPVIDEDTGRVIKIISQSQVTSILNEMLKTMEKNKVPIPKFFNETIDSLGGFGVRPVFTVQVEKDKARDAFRLIIDEGVSAVGVLDDEGKLWTSISTKDIRLFQSVEDAAMQRYNAETDRRRGSIDISPSLMDMDCGDFVSAAQIAAETGGVTRVPAVVVHTDLTMRKVISKLAVSKKHRLFIVDADKKPIGCISVSDISALLLGIQSTTDADLSGFSKFLCEKFSNVKLSTLPTPPAIVQLSSTDCVNKAFRTLVDSNLLSAPVWDETKLKYLGFFDIADAMAMVYSVDLLMSSIPCSMVDPKYRDGDDVANLKEGWESELLVGELMEDEEREWSPLPFDACLRDAITAISERYRNKRIAVLNEEGKIHNIISQSLVASLLHDILKDMETNREPIPLFFKKRLGEISSWNRKAVLAVGAESSTVRDAFKVIIENNVSAVCVVDEEGKFLSSVSTKDIRLFQTVEQAVVERILSTSSEEHNEPNTSQNLMDMKTGDFVEMLSSSAGVGDVHLPSVVVQENSCVYTVISRMVLSKQHRVFVCDDQRRPSGVISVSDICKIIASNMPCVDSNTSNHQLKNAKANKK